MTTQSKQNPVATIKNVLKKHERKILIATTVVSTTSAVLMKTGLAQHNAFLKEHGLFDEFYGLNQNV